MYFGKINPDREYFFTICHHCLGSKCEKCKKGYIEYKGNYKEHINEKARGLFKAYYFLKEYKVWPVNEGMINQNAKFIKTIEFVDMVKQRYNEIEQTEMEAKQRMARLKHG